MNEEWEIRGYYPYCRGSVSERIMVMPKTAAMVEWQAELCKRINIDPANKTSFLLGQRASRNTMGISFYDNSVYIGIGIEHKYGEYAQVDRYGHKTWSDSKDATESKD